MLVDPIPWHHLPAHRAGDLAGGVLLKNERIEEEAEGTGGAPLTSASFFFLFLLRDKLLRGLLFSGDVASDIVGLKSTSTAWAASFD